MYIVVSGNSEVGYRIVEELMHVHNVVFIRSSGEASARLDQWDANVVDGSSTSPEVLREAGVDKADFYLATTANDEKNIVSCVAARRLGARNVVCFLQRRGFLSLETNDTDFADSLGIDAVIRPSALLAEEIVRIVTVPGALDVRTFAGGRIRLLRFEVEPGSKLDGVMLKDAGLPRGTLIVMARRGDEIFIPRGLSTISAGDKLTAIGTRDGIRRLNRYRFGGFGGIGRKRHRVLVVGGGQVGFAVAEELVSSGWKVTLIESDEERAKELASSVDCLVINGDGSDPQLLEQELVFDVSALIAVTSNDEKNLLISLLAKQMGVPRILTRASKLVNEKIFERVGVDVVLSAHGAALRWVIDDVLEMQTHHVAELEHGDVSVLEIVLPKEFPRQTLRKLNMPEYAVIGGILRDGRATIPFGEFEVAPDDHLFVFCAREDADAIERFLTEPSETTTSDDDDDDEPASATARDAETHAPSSRADEQHAPSETSSNERQR